MLLSNGELAPIAFAETTPAFSNRVYYPPSTLTLANAHATYGQIYKSQVWVATLVNKLAFGVARLPLKVYERQDAGRTEARDTPLARLLRNPNPRHDPFFFWLWTASTFEVYGEALWVKLRPGPGQPPAQLWPLHPSNVYTRREDDGSLTYVFALGGAVSSPILTFSQSDIVHFRSYNPEDQIRGMSRLEPLRQTIISEDAARRAATAFWQNGARPSVLLHTEKTLTQPVIDRVSASWRAIHGGVDSWGKTALLEEGLTPTILPLNAEEMQYIESRKLNREEVCGIYDVPPPVVHILDRATFSNITEQMRSMYRDTMAPRLGLLESVLDSQLRPDFDPQGILYAEFLMDEVLRGSFEQRATAYETMTRIAGMTPAEVRQRENLPDLGPATHRLYVNAATVPLEDVAAEQPPQVVEHPVPVKTVDAQVVCAACERPGSLSRRGLCRSCEGRASRALAHPKEIES